MTPPGERLYGQLSLRQPGCWRATLQGAHKLREGDQKPTPLLSRVCPNGLSVDLALFGAAGGAIPEGAEPEWGVPRPC